MSNKEVEKRLIADCEKKLAALCAARALQASAAESDLFGDAAACPTRAVAEAHTAARSAIDTLKQFRASA